MLQGLFGPHAVGGVLGVGNGQALQAAIFEGGSQVFQLAIGLQRRSVRHHQAYAAQGIQPPPVAGFARIGQAEHKALVRRHEHLEGRTLGNLRIQVA